MSNIIPIAQGAGLPAYLQQGNLPVQSNLGAGIAAHAPRLGITITREFTLTKNGQTQILPPVPSSDGRSMRNAVRCVLLTAAPTLNKAWFSKPYVPGSDAVPDCYSDDASVPAPAAEHKQSALCATCPKNAFGSHPVTGRGKACSDRKRVVLALESDPDTAVVINWPTMSLGALKNLDSSLQQGRIPMQALMVELSFDLSVQYSKIMLNPVGFVPEETFRALKALADLPATQELLREAIYDDAETPPPTGLPATPAYLQQPAYGPAATPQATHPLVQPAPLTPEQQQAAAFAAWQAQQAAPVPPTEPAAPAAGPAQSSAPAVAATPVQSTVGVPTAGVAVPPAGSAPAEAPKRKRRTKAEMEAARAAEAAQAAAAPAQATLQIPMGVVEGLPGVPVQPAVVPGIPADQAAAFAAWQAQQAAAAPPAVQVMPAVQAAPETVTPPPAQTAANVMDLISRWKQNG